MQGLAPEPQVIQGISYDMADLPAGSVVTLWTQVSNDLRQPKITGVQEAKEHTQKKLLAVHVHVSDEFGHMHIVAECRRTALALPLLLPSFQSRHPSL